MNQMTPTIFHTESVADYHEYELRILLHKYENILDASDINDIGNNILTDDTAYTKAAQSYQRIITHYLCAKMELWMGLFMNPTHGVTSGLLNNEFATRRGVIHFHSILYSAHQRLPVNEIINDGTNDEEEILPKIAYNENTPTSSSSQIDMNMTNHTISIYRAFTNLDYFIYIFYTPYNAYPTNPLSIARRNDGMEKRKDILETINGGKHIWDRFIEDIRYLAEQLDTAISSTMELN